MSISDKLTQLSEAKSAIASAIVDKDGTVTGGFSSFADDIRNLPTGGGGISYSAEEQDTGLTWIDGKKIYQKTYVGSIGAYTEFVIESDFSLNKYLINAYGVLRRANNKEAMLVPSCLNSTYFAGFYIDRNTDDLKLYNSATFGNSNYELTVTYTKA